MKGLSLNYLFFYILGDSLDIMFCLMEAVMQTVNQQLKGALISTRNLMIGAAINVVLWGVIGLAVWGSYSLIRWVIQ